MTIQLHKDMKMFIAAAVFTITAALLPAEFFSSERYGWIMDLPEGFKIADITPDEQSVFMEHTFMPVRLAVKLYPSTRYTRSDLALEDVLNTLNADGEIEGFDWNGAPASISSFSFTLNRNMAKQNGWGLSTTLQENDMHMIILCYTDEDKANDCAQFLLSVIDSLSPDESALRKSGPVSCYGFPVTEPATSEIKIDGKKIFTRFDKDASQASRFAIDREFAVLSLYAGHEKWKEAWQRYYRLIFRDSYGRFDECAKDIYGAIYPKAAAAGKDGLQLRLTELILEWVQGFDYTRQKNKADFEDLISAAENKGSDCDSRSLLACVLLEHFGIKTELFVSREYSHAVFGAAVKAPGAAIKVDGQDYLLGETTSHVKIGLMAQDMSDTEKWIPVDLP